MATHLYTHSIFTEHKTPPGHPERVERIEVLQNMFSQNRFSKLKQFQTSACDESLFALAHPKSFIEGLAEKSPWQNYIHLDADTVMSEKTWECVKHAVGGGVALVDDILSGKADNGFLCARPPGHHAEKNVAMGFCLVNTAAIMARYAQQQGIERVAIIDFDVHHGNGTQDIFFNDKTVFYGSSHQMPLFPGTGASDEVGVGNICNTPLSSGSGSEDFREAYESKILPSLENFAPGFIIISAGFDAHHLDPLANINLRSDDFDWITGKLLDIGNKYSKNRLVSLLEGGYDLTGLADSCSAHIERLMRG